MHIPSHMLQGPICPVTAAVSVAGIGLSAFLAVKSKDKPSPVSFGAVAALIFAGQMMNFPVMNGTSGHLLGATLAIALLGAPYGILAMTMVLALQSLFFADGGLSVLGANILNMALMGAIPGVLIHRLIRKQTDKPGVKEYALTFLAAWASVVLASTACSAELAIAGTIPFSKVFPAMTGVHMLIGLGEGLITIAAFALFSSKIVASSPKRSGWVILSASAVIGLLLSPFASGFPDGLEWVAERLAFLKEAAPTFVSPFADYTVPFVSHEVVSTGLAGIIGVAITFCLVWGIGALLSLSRAKKVTVDKE